LNFLLCLYKLINTDKKEKKMAFEIKLKCIHKCNKYCKTTLVGPDGNAPQNNADWIIGVAYRDGPNPNYNHKTKRCDKYGKKESHAIYLDRYDPDNWDKSTNHILNPDEIVIMDSHIHIEFSYPLNNPLNVDLSSKNPNGFTKKEIVDHIVRIYREIYAEEERTAHPQAYTVKSDKMGEGISDVQEHVVIPTDQRQLFSCMINRNSTEGVYGIWGHDLSDLAIEGLTYNPETKELTMHIGS